MNTVEELTKLVEELRASNVLWGKKWVACGDSFTEGDFKDAPAGEELKFADGLYAGEKKVYPFFIGRRNHMDIVNEAKCGSTMTDLGTRKDSFSIERYKKIPADADYIIHSALELMMMRDTRRHRLVRLVILLTLHFTEHGISCLSILLLIIRMPRLVLSLLTVVHSLILRQSEELQGSGLFHTLM